jgi:hypothetical protein
MTGSDDGMYSLLGFKSYDDFKHFMVDVNFFGINNNTKKLQFQDNKFIDAQGPLPAFFPAVRGGKSRLKVLQVGFKKATNSRPPSQLVFDTYCSLLVFGGC